MCHAAKEALWLQSFMKELHAQEFMHEPQVLLVDNQGDIVLAKNQITSDRSKHIDLKYHFLREKVEEERLQLRHSGMLAFSIDVNDLHYSLPHSHLLEVVNEGIETYGVVRFQNECGTSVDRFLDLLMYLRSYVVQFAGKMYLQNEGVCIGSCLAPVLSDLSIARYDRDIQGNLLKGHVKVLRYVDDYLVFIDADDNGFDTMVRNVYGIFGKTMEGLTLTKELPEDGTLRFLDLLLFFKNEHVKYNG
ncbi:uncharacterized protein LOC119386476 [Rhipicephalus sanguineus]|uniref:uncharacterized protein LOC119386476 n=1 Tax=Rhipicephalus sanguineus TaxID=34632 RepID=UPI001892DF64|nr:uncharacterized protein LOC119386476 [Rhipicephalus sanguineus]